MAQVSVRDARTQLADIVNKVARGKERHTVTRHGKAVAAVVPIEDLRLLEELEDRLDAAAAQEALGESDDRIPYQHVQRELGLIE